MPLEIYTSDQMPPRPLRVFVYGQPGTGKTTFAGTFPNPVMLSAGQEGGDTTLRFIPGITVMRVQTVQDMKEAVGIIETQYAHKQWGTVVVDSATFYADIFIAEIVKSGRAMRQQDWGLLDVHLQKWLLPTLHRLPLHVVWIALEHEKQIEGGPTKTLPMLYGKTATKLPAATDMILHAEVIQVTGPNNEPVTKFIMRTRSWAGAFARDRFGNAFAEGYIEPHFGHIANRIGPHIGMQPQQPAGNSGTA